MSSDDFARQFQDAATEILRMYSTCYTLMEIEMGTAPAQLLAPHYLGDVVAAAERLALSRQGKEVVAPEEPGHPAARRQLTIEEALAAEQAGAAPW